MMRPAQLKDYIDGLVKALHRHQLHTAGSYYGTASWIYAHAGEIYVRPNGLHILGNEVVSSSYDFANLNINQNLRGQGIMMGVIEEWHNWHGQPITYIENVSNERFAEHLRKREGWIEVDYWESGCSSFYKPR